MAEHGLKEARLWKRGQDTGHLQKEIFLYFPLQVNFLHFIKCERKMQGALGTCKRGEWHLVVSLLSAQPINKHNLLEVPS